jgi:hypothetical protein
MPLLVNSVPNLAQGVSQQPDNLRYPGQCDEQINAWATVVEGLKKRPNTNYVKNIDTTSTSSNLFTHFVKRDETNQYVVTVSLGGVSAYNLSLGTRVSVFVTSIANSYLSLGTSVTDPLNDLRALTVADYTFLVNKRREVKRNSVDRTEDFRNLEDAADPRYEALIFPKIGDYEKAYSIYIDDSLVAVGSTLQGSEHDFSHVSSNDSQDATYISGPSSKAVHADTEHIARDLLIALQDWLPDPAVPDSITSFSLNSGFEGAGFEDSGVRPTDISQPLRPSVEIRYEFNILQYDSSGTLLAGKGAGGNLVMESGSISSFNLNRRGRGYRTGVAGDVLEMEIIKYEIIRANAFASSRILQLVGKSDVLSLKKYIYNRDSVPSFFTDVTMPQITATVGNADFTAERNGSVIKLSSNLDFNIRVEDGLASQGLGLAYKEVDSITELPKNCYNNFKIKVKGDPDINQDDYYVRFQTKGREDFGSGSYIETVGWKASFEKGAAPEGIPFLFDPTTMPVVLVQQQDGTFILQTPNERINYVKHNNVIYKLVEDHISASATEPGGTTDSDSDGIPDWKAYWIVTTEVSTANPWSLNKAYAVTEAGWTGRAAGDDFTNPFPTFTDKTVNDVFFFKNRLGFVSDTSVIFSEADEYFNFFRTTTQQLLDSAPIDVGLSHTKVATLQHAIPFQEKLMLFSKQSQFVLRGADVLSPKTVAISPVTEYDISDSVEPVALGNYIYFTFKRNDFEGMYEYFVDNNTELFDAEEVTQQVPKYIPNNVRKIAGSQAENTLCIGVDSDLKTLYVYKYFWSNKEKIQSAWMKFTFDRDVVGFDFIDSKLYMITKDDEGLHLEFLTLEDGLTDEGLGYPLLLDSRVDGNDVTVSLYNASTKKTRISGIPYNVSLGTDIEIYTKIGTQRAITMVDNTTVDVTGALASYVSNGGTVYKCVHTDPDTQVHTSTAATEPGTGADWTDYWVVSTDFSSATAWALGKTYNDDTYFFIGKPYNMTYRFSNQAIKQPTERGGRSASDYTFQTIRNGSINYADTGHFVVEVTPEYRDTYKYVFNPDITGANLLLNEFEPQDGHFRFAVQGQPDKVTIEVKSDSALPCKLLAAEFESMVIPRSKRYGS